MGVLFLFGLFFETLLSPRLARNSLGSLAEDATLNLTILMFSASPELDYSCMLPLPVYMVLDCVGQAPTEPYSTMFLNFDRLFVM